jgi:hypothetical protein
MYEDPVPTSQCRGKSRITRLGPSVRASDDDHGGAPCEGGWDSAERRGTVFRRFSNVRGTVAELSGGLNTAKEWAGHQRQVVEERRGYLQGEEEWCFEVGDLGYFGGGGKQSLGARRIGGVESRGEAVELSRVQNFTL